MPSLWHRRAFEPLPTEMKGNLPLVISMKGSRMTSDAFSEAL